MKKIYATMIAATIAIAASAQVKQTIDKAIGDPARNKNAGKADVITMEKHNLSPGDSAAVSGRPEKQTVAVKQKTKTVTKKKRCIRKSATHKKSPK